MRNSIVRFGKRETMRNSIVRFGKRESLGGEAETSAEQQQLADDQDTQAADIKRSPNRWIRPNRLTNAWGYDPSIIWRNMPLKRSPLQVVYQQPFEFDIDEDDDLLKRAYSFLELLAYYRPTSDS